MFKPAEMLQFIARLESLCPLVRNTAGFRYGQAALPAHRFISTRDQSKHSVQLTESNDPIGRLPRNLVLKQKMEKSRTLSTLQNQTVPISARVTETKDESRDFMAVFPDLVQSLTEVIRKHKCYDSENWFAKALQYNLPHGKKSRGLLTVMTYKNLVKAEQLTPENIKLAQYLGWCVELLQSFFVIADDIVDNGTTRRGQPCWHRVNDVGLVALNDALMIESAIFTILKQHFSHLDCYVDLLELFHDITYITTCGQSMDLLTSRKKVTTFTMETYKSISANKTSYYSFYLPVALAMRLAGVKDAEAFCQSENILLEMGHFFQVQDDFLDCFGDAEITGKIGTDIQENKCSWLAVVCMQRANETQKAIMAECYGQDDPAKVERVKELYKELGLPDAYAAYEEDSYKTIKAHIQQISQVVPQKVFFDVLNKIYQRVS